MTNPLPGAVSRFIDATNAFDADAILATFTDDALINDIQRDFWGAESIKRFIDKEIVGADVTMAVTGVRQHYDIHIVRAQLDGSYDKTNLPDPLELNFYFTVSGDKISSLFVINTRPGY